MEESISGSLESTNRALSLLIAKAKSNGGFSLDIFSWIFDATVTPIIEFSAHLWAFKERPRVNQVQYNALRFFFGVGKASPIAALLGDSGWVPIQMSLKYTLHKYWYCVCNRSQERLLRSSQWYQFTRKSAKSLILCYHWRLPSFSLLAVVVNVC